MRGGCLGLFGALILLGLFIKYWMIAVPLIVVVFICCWIGAGSEEKAKRQAQAALEAEAARRVHQEELEQAQLQHHQNALAAADPVYGELVGTLARVPVTRPIDRERVERAMAERFAVIDGFARHFAELERNGQPVPDHGATMRELVEKERAWDARSDGGRHRGA
jgi:hypothetical protein